MTADSPHPDRSREAGFSLIELLVVMLVISVIAMITIQSTFYAFDAARLSRSVANMRQISSAIMQYESTASTVPAGGLQPVSAIVATLGPQGTGLATRDGWNNDLYYEPVTVGSETTFRVYCYGKDATPDGTVTGIWANFFTDVVLEGGSFIQTKW